MSGNSRQKQGNTAEQKIVNCLFSMFVNEILGQMEIKAHAQVQFDTRNLILEPVLPFGLPRRSKIGKHSRSKILNCSFSMFVKEILGQMEIKAHAQVQFDTRDLILKPIMLFRAFQLGFRVQGFVLFSQVLGFRVSQCNIKVKRWVSLSRINCFCCQALGLKVFPAPMLGFRVVGEHRNISWTRKSDIFAIQSS